MKIKIKKGSVEKEIDSMKVEPLHNFVCVYKDPDPEASPGGIVYSQNTKFQDIARGTVIATGPGGFNSDGVRIEMSLKVGDKVCWHAHAGWPVHDHDSGVTYLMLREPEICGRFPNG